MLTRKMKWTVLFSMVLFIVMATSAVSKEIYVSPDYPGVIEDVVNDPTTVDGDILILAPGIYKGYFTTEPIAWHAPIDPKGKNLTFRSMNSTDPEYEEGYDYVKNTIIYGGVHNYGGTLDGWWYMPAAYFHNGEGLDCQLICLTIKCGFIFSEGVPPHPEGWHCGYGTLEIACAAVLCDGASPKISKCKIEGGDTGEQHLWDICGISCKNSNALIQNCAIYRANADSTAIVLYGGNVTIENSTILGNPGQSIYSHGEGNVTITNCTIDGEGVNQQGLDLSNSREIKITGSTIRNCSGTTKGAGIHISNKYVDVEIDDCTLTDNYATSEGGAICIEECAKGIINDCKIIGNEADEGGGIHIHGSDAKNVTINKCVISDNNAIYTKGGGIFNFSDGTTVTHCKITGNKALHSSNGYGGGICSGWSDVKRDINIINCEITKNQAGNNGGGIWLNGSGNIVNCTVADNNSGGYGVGAYLKGASSSKNTYLTNCIFWGDLPEQQIKRMGDRDYTQISHCNIKHSKRVEYPLGSEEYYIVDEAYVSGDPDDYAAGKDLRGNIDEGPCFVDAGENDFHLNRGSPCIDAGDNTVVEAGSVDIDGDIRRIDDPEAPDTGFPADDSPYVDIGADEVNCIFSKWKFDEDEGSIANDSIGDNDGTVHGATWTSGLIDGALDFDGINDYVSVGDSESMRSIDGSTAKYTISLWVKTTQSGAARWNQKAIFDRRATGKLSDKNHWVAHIYLNQYNSVGFLIKDDSEWLYLDDTLAINNGKWHHIAAVRNGTDYVKVYVDGDLRLDDSTTANPSTAEITTIGVRRTNYNYLYGYFDGKIDDVRIYGRALSEGEIQQLYQQIYKAFEPNPPDGAIGVDTDTVLSWSPGKNADSHNVYFGTTNPPQLLEEEQTSTTYDPGTLEYNTNYYWRIDEVSTSTIYKGDVWSFTTWLEPNLISWWEFNEGEGDVAHDSASENDGAITDAAWFDDPDRGMCLDFDGDNSYVSVPDDDSLDISGAITVSIWLKLDEDVSVCSLVRKIDSGGCYFYGGYRLLFDNRTVYTDGTYRLVFQKADGTSGTGSGNYGTNTNWDRVVSETNSWEAGRWYHVVATWDGTTDINSMKMYINGVLDASHTAGQGTIKTNSYNLKMSGSFDGKIDDVRIYNKALSVEEVEQLYEDGL